MDRRRFLAAIPALGALAAAARLPQFAWADVGDPQPIVAGAAAFGFDLYNRLREKPGNLFCSPFSIETALAMTGSGAAGDTQSEMSRVLHLALDKGEAVHSGFAALVKTLTSLEGKGAPELRIANALWGSANFTFKQEFLNTLKEYYGAGFQTVNFAEAEAARQKINGWVEEQTKDKIKELFPQGVLNEMTRLVLVNAIYFKGTWKTTFDKEATQDAPFYGATEVKVPLMHKTFRMQYAEGDDWQAVELPYRSSDLTMVVALPRKRDGLAGLEAKLNPQSWAKETSKLNPEMVALSLPRFKSESAFALKDTLSAMGMAAAFSPDRANFSRMSDEKQLFIQAVIHKAVVEVNEEGTEAAAATGVAVGARSAAPTREPKVVTCDHPFLYFIRDTKTGAILFMGRLTDPKA
ncbi:MAG: serpin family protein [Gemmataceae bacterium]